MKFSLKELKIISKWFDETSEDLNDLDLKVYDKINHGIKEKEEDLYSDDPLIFPTKKLKKDNETYEDDNVCEEEFDDKEEYKAYIINKNNEEEED